MTYDAISSARFGLCLGWGGAECVLAQVFGQLVSVKEREQVRTHRRHRLLDDVDDVATERADQILATPGRLHLREVIAGVAASALLSQQRSTRDALAHQEHVAQIQR